MAQLLLNSVQLGNKLQAGSTKRVLVCIQTLVKGFNRLAKAKSEPKQLTLLTAEEAANYLRLHVKSLYRLAREGKIPARKVGGQWRFHSESLNNWLKISRSDSSVS